MKSLKFAKVFLDSQHICKHLCRMELICKSVPYRNFTVLCKSLNNLLVKASVLDSIEHTCKNSCSIGDTLFFSNLRVCRIEESRSHSKIRSCNFKRASGTRTCLLKNKSDILSSEFIVENTLFFLSLKLCCKIDKIFNLLCRIIKKFQKIASF